MELEKISKTDYQNEKGLKLVFSDFPSVFAKITTDKETVLISWKSELIEPSLKLLDDKLFIGVDSKFAIFHLGQGIVLALLPLSSNFFSLLVSDKAMIIISELEVLILNQEDYSIRKHLHLPDVIEDYKEISDGLKLFCMDGTSMEVRY